MLLKKIMIEFYLSQKAEILKDIELFYSLPHQRRRTDWFLISFIIMRTLTRSERNTKKLFNKEYDLIHCLDSYNAFN
ncbi:hypothetical protein GLOIN_2v1783763 [Rhizophagus irregularis DAOM 181602=DAOM 197198]|nr:hypothetical protein GLOIN_2v1783763 [Rhizophagus irregularis DAOM 181602=DAOM 197198]